MGWDGIGKDTSEGREFLGSPWHPPETSTCLQLTRFLLLPCSAAGDCLQLPLQRLQATLQLLLSGWGEKRVGNRIGPPCLESFLRPRITSSTGAEPHCERLEMRMGMSQGPVPSLDGMGEEFGAENGDREELLHKFLSKWLQGKVLGLKTEKGMSHSQTPLTNAFRERAWG